MELGLTDAVAVVTGAASGIGAATARCLANEGAKVALLDLDGAKAAAVAQELSASGVDALGVTCDVADEDSTRAAIETVAEHFGGIDALLCCAGISGLYGRTIEQVTVPEWDQLMAVNVRGQWLPVKLAIPHLRRSQQAAVVIIASDSALVASPLHVPYCASKGGVLMLTKALAVDLRSDGVRVNCVCPSIVDTAMSRADLGLTEQGFDKANYPVQTADDIARYMTLLAAPATRTISGHPLVADYGYLAESNFPA